MACSVRLMICIAIACFSFAVPISAEEPQPIKDIEYKAPKTWRYEAGRERWGGGDPTFNLNKGWATMIRVTHYGLAGSRFKTPEDFESYLDNLFSGERKETKDLTISGKKAKSILLRYKYDEFTDHHGAFIPRQYAYDEFVILPLREGFLVFNLAIYRSAPLPESILPDDEWYPKLEKDRPETIKDWRDFLKSCKIKQEKSPQLIMEAEKKTFEPGEAIDITVRLKNTSRNEITVCNIWLPSLQIEFIATRNGARIEPFDIKYELKAIEKENFITLEPGKDISRAFNILKCIPIKEPGAYNIKASYKNWYDWYDDYSGGEMKKVPVAAWKGTLTSNAITIKVVK